MRTIAFDHVAPDSMHTGRGWARRLRRALCVIVVGLAGASAAAQERGTIQRDATASWAEIVALDATLPKREKPMVAPGMPDPIVDLKPVASAPQGGGVQPGPAGGYSSRVACASLGIEPALSTNFQGLDDNNGSIPPDTMGAVGINHVMTTLNTQVRIASRAGASASTVSLNTFWAHYAPLPDAFDPVLHFDARTNRWFFIACADAPIFPATTSDSRVLLAASRTSDPTGTWDFYSFDADATNATWADYAMMGMNDTWIAITANMFNGSTYAGTRMWVISKSTVLGNSGTLFVSHFLPGFDARGGHSGFTLRPAICMDANSGVLYIADVATSNTTFFECIRLSAITGTANTPGWDVLPGGPYPGTGLFFVDNYFGASMPFAPQLGSTQLIATGGTRLHRCIERNGHLWLVHGGGHPWTGPTRTAVFWYELQPSLASPIVQSGVIDGGNGVSLFYPSMAVNCGNDAAIGFTMSSASIYASAAYAVHVAADGPGTTRVIRTLKAGEAPYYKIFSGSINRWGDYSATCVDPVGDANFWTLQEYAALPSGGTDRWGVWWGMLQCYLPPVSPTGQRASFNRCDGVQITWDYLAPTEAPGFDIIRSYFGPDIATGITLPGVAVSGYVDTTAVTNVTGWYWVRARNACGLSPVYSAVAGFRSAAPSIPSLVTATNGTSCSYVRITWTASVGTVTGYKVYRSTSSAFPGGTPLATLGAVTLFDDTTAVAGTTYNYWVVATSTCGDTVHSTPDDGYKGRTLTGPPLNLVASDQTSCVAVNITWSTLANATGYRLYRGTTNNFSSATLIVDNPIIGFTDFTAVPGTQYYYWIFGYSTCMDSSGTGPEQGSRATPPTFYSESQDQSVAVGTNLYFGVGALGTTPITYQWHRNGVPLTDDLHINGSTQVSLQINNAQLSDAATYTCIATNLCGSITSRSMILEVTPSCVGPTITSSPADQNLCAGASTTLSITITGTTPRYLRWRKGSTDLFDGAYISGTVTTTLILSNLQVANSGLYSCVATNSCGSTQSIEANIAVGAPLTSAPPRPDASNNRCDGILVEITVPTSGATSYNLYKSETTSPPGSSFVTITGTTSYLDTAATPGVATNYWYTATNACGTSPLSSQRGSGFRVVLPAAPASVTASDGTACTGIDVSWSPVNSAASYNIYRASTNSFAAAALLTSVPSAAPYTDTAANSNATYFYWVSAVNDCGEGPVGAPDGGSHGIATAIVIQPINVLSQSSFDAQIGLQAIGTSLTYQWRRNSSNLSDGSSFSGTQTPILTVHNVTSPDEGNYTCIVTGTCGSVTSNVAVLSRPFGGGNCENVNIQGSIASQTVCAGQSVTLLAPSVLGTNPTYQWRKNGSNISGATLHGYYIPSAAAADAADYSVRITNICGGNQFSNDATLTVSTGPTITNQPSNLTRCEGESAQFSISATGQGVIAYQWRKNSVNISGATNSTYSIGAVVPSDAGTYTCLLTDSCGTRTSANRTLTVNPLVVFTSHPVSTTRCLGQSVAFSVAASNVNTYRWRKDGVNIAGATGAGSTYTIAAVAAGDAASYTCRITNACGNLISDPAVLTIASAPPTISTHPAGTSTCINGDATFSVVAAGTGPFTYQWRKNAADIAGATSDAYSISGASLADAGSFDCVVLNACGSATSDAATLSVCVADLDDGTGTGTCDGGVGIEDLLLYLALYDLGDTRADVDDGSGTGTTDGGVGIEDLLYYLLRYDAGC